MEESEIELWFEEEKKKLETEYLKKNEQKIMNAEEEVLFVKKCKELRNRYDSMQNKFENDKKTNKRKKQIKKVLLFPITGTISAIKGIITFFGSIFERLKVWWDERSKPLKEWIMFVYYKYWYKIVDVKNKYYGGPKKFVKRKVGFVIKHWDIKTLPTRKYIEKKVDLVKDFIKKKVYAPFIKPIIEIIMKAYDLVAGGKDKK